VRMIASSRVRVMVAYFPLLGLDDRPPAYPAI
jgi:hypothetical protein